MKKKLTALFLCLGFLLCAGCSKPAPQPVPALLPDVQLEFPSQFTAAAIGNLINERLFENRPTIISTNLSVKELTERYSERTASRILGEYKRLLFVGEDIRFLKNR